MSEFMTLAVEEAMVGVTCGDGGPFGAVIVRDGKVVARGHNMVLRHNDSTAHAEMVAIRNACKELGTFELKGCTLYTSCYPCPMCMGAALWARVNGIYYAANSADAAEYDFDDSTFHDFVKNPVNLPERALEELKTDNYLDPFKAWNKIAHKRQY